MYIIKSKADFDYQIKAAGHRLVVVDFFAVWCGPCKMIAPILEEFSSQYDGDVIFLKVDVDERPDVATLFDIGSMPTFIFIKNRQKVAEFAGANPEKLAATIEMLI